MKLKLDPWQEKVLATKGNKCICSGRQVGKSTVISIDAGEFAIKNKKTQILIISSVERQAQELFQKVLHYLQDNYKSYILKGSHKPTLSKIELGNGSIIRCLPTGIDGHGIRGFTVDRLYADEAHYIDDKVWDAVTPMLLTTGGDQILLSTPRGNEGHFYNMFYDKSFTSFHVSTPDVMRDREISDTWTLQQRDAALDLIEREKRIKTELVFAQEYLGQFVGGLMQFFPNKLINSITTLKESNISYPPTGFFETYLGVDIARMGDDETALASLYKQDDKLTQFDLEVTTKTLTTDTTDLILLKDRIYNYKKIYLDDGGLGVAVFDPLLRHEQTKRKVVGINNASRSITPDKRRNKKLLKEDLYFNLKNLMERNKITLLQEPRTIQSLKSIQYEYGQDGNIRIYGKYTHIVEGLIRAAWCMQDKKLDVFIC